MSSLTDARRNLADAISATGMDCEPYPPDSLVPPAAFVDSVTVDYSAGAGWSFCEQGMATATITTCAQRNDRAGSTQMLEDAASSTLKALESIDGVRVVSMQSGSAEISGAALPAVIYTVEFGLSG